MKERQLGSTPTQKQHIRKVCQNCKRRPQTDKFVEVVKVWQISETGKRVMKTHLQPQHL